MYYIIFSIVFLLSLMANKNGRLLSWVLLLILSIFCALRGNRVDRDYLNYYNLWYIDLQPLAYYFTEPFSKIIFTYSYTFSIPFYIVMLVFCIFSLIPKFIIVNKLQASMPVFLCLYVGYFYWQHDFTQVRVASALGFIFIAFYFWAKRKIGKTAIFLFIAALFHTSALIASVMFILNTNKKSIPLYVGLMFFSFALAIVHLDLIFIIKQLVKFIPLLNKYMFYFSVEWGAQEINIFNVTNLSLMFLLCFSSYYIYSSESLMRAKGIKYEALVGSLKLSLLGLSAIPAFASLPVASFRVSQILLIFVCITLSLLYKSFNLSSRLIILVLSFLYGVTLTYIVIDNAGILSDYYLVL